jgi:class 3 adenylate cyclase/uncharacterized protein YndB with AHSA1/START domain
MTRSDRDDPTRAQSKAQRERGTLLLADISGYTSYLTEVELEHSGDIVAGLLDAIVEQLAAWRVDEVEGDAVFAHAPHETLDADALIATVEACYFAFADQRGLIGSRSTCPCRACRGVQTLDLKVIVHESDYVTQRIAGMSKLMGPGVILAHRLLKNEVTSRTALRGYALMTDACIEAYGLDPASLEATAHAEEYDVGPVHGHLLDLRARWRGAAERRQVVVTGEECFLAFEVTTSLPPGSMWEWLNDPRRLDTWHADQTSESVRGSRGVGTVIHCLHGRMAGTREILDWKPYRYFTTRQWWPGFQMVATSELVPTDDGGTRVVFRYRQDGNRRSRLLATLGAPVLRRVLRDSYSKLQEVLHEAESRGLLA